ncbi:DUF262 domain-containing protein [Flavobacterium notoginsengisoli]|uniref:DUF262 domain-containing protein n=1 Tax=Flavobacterium notoginsengisoli TaxID=1478199 RepID=UPI003629FF6F
MKDTFTLQEIANWQLDFETSIVELPSVQRGFVWKPKQIEDLWDSILRGYPIGSFLFSKTTNKLNLMDGQQRATSIFLGHFNPYCFSSETKTWSIKGELPVVWLDIKPEQKPDTSKYLVRLTSRSHPWGYQHRENNKPLSVSDRRKALELFQKHPNNTGGYTTFKNTTTFPVDAWFPLPLVFFIEANSPDEVIEKAELHLPDYFATLRGSFENKETFITLLKTDLKQDLNEICNTVNKIKSIVIKSNIIEDRVLNEENEEENPTLFVRINSSGTTLTGDDLIYSIYKSLFPKAKDFIETSELNFIPPTQILSLASRFVASNLDENHAYIKKMNVRDFQRRLKNEDFKTKLERFIIGEQLDQLFQKAICMLSCKDNPLFDGEIPPVLIKHFIKRNQDLFLFLVYWLHLHKTEITKELEQKIVGKLYTFAWFGFDNIPHLWNQKIKNKNFWNEPLNELIWWTEEDGTHFLIKPDLLKAYYAQPKILDMFRTKDEHRWGLWMEGAGNDIINYFKSVKTKGYNSEKANDYFWQFIGKIRHNRPLILLAQREYINTTFTDYNQLEDVEDTNAPWDWDHIYASEWVYYKKNINSGIKEWNNTNGNFRAISLEQNRKEGHRVKPNERLSLEDDRKISFVNEDWNYWMNIEARISDNNIVNHFQAITTRMINIYEKFWNDFKIGEMIKYEL